MKLLLNGKNVHLNGVGMSKTVGKHSYELQQKDEKINPIDLQRAVHEGNTDDDSYENQVRLAVDRGLQDYEGDFYVVVLFKKERLMVNVVRQYFFPRKTCPRPEYDQVVYKYHRHSHSLKFMWVIPDKLSCETLPLHKNFLPDDQKEFLKFVLDFNSGELDKISDRMNIEDMKDNSL